jgi:16S rRNA (adenine1518-N6/adenine1519-N6)-dimethyltransferase
MAHSLDALPPLRDTIAHHNLRAEKSLGQNFLLDLNITRKIARLAGDLSQGTVMEIGPGPGGLTRALLYEGAGNVIAIEKDRRALAPLHELQAHADGRLHIIQGDALDIDVTQLGTAPRRIIANLPYNIATPLLVGWLRQIAENPGCIAQMLLMFQKEVGERITARPGNKTYGRLSVLCQWLCHAEGVYSLPPSAFTPKPKVESMVVRLVPRQEKLFAASFADVEKLTQAAFGQRRKMLRAALKTLWPDAEARLLAAGIPPTARAEDIAVQDFGKLI